MPRNIEMFLETRAKWLLIPAVSHFSPTTATGGGVCQQYFTPCEGRPAIQDAPSCPEGVEDGQDCCRCDSVCSLQTYKLCQNLGLNALLLIQILSKSIHSTLLPREPTELINQVAPLRDLGLAYMLSFGNANVGDLYVNRRVSGGKTVFYT